MYKTTRFARFAKATAHYTGHPIAFGLAVSTIVVWLVSGPIFGFSDTWQLVINTATTIVTFLMVFLIQNTQNRDALALQIKLDELIRATKGAHTALLDLEELSDKEIHDACTAYHELAADARKDMRRGRKDTGTPPIGRGHSSSGHNGAAHRR